MATFTEPRTTNPSSFTPKRSKGQVIVDWMTTTDHKKIGYLYLVTSFIYFLIAGVMALVIRAQLALPGLDIVATKEQYNQLFTMHGTIMLLMFATPLFAGFANVLMPVQIGAPDVAFPRLNAIAYWFFSFGSFIAVAGLLYSSGSCLVRLVCLCSALEHDLFSRYRRRFVGLWTCPERFWHNPGWSELHHHNHHHASPRNDDVAHANFHLEHNGDLDSDHHVLPTARRRTICTWS
jgi:hypothetical protein